MGCSFFTSECIHVRLSVSYICQRRVLQLHVGAENRNQTHKEFTSYRLSLTFVFSRSSVQFLSVTAQTNELDVFQPNNKAPSLPFIVFHLYCNSVGLYTNPLRCLTKSQYSKTDFLFPNTVNKVEQIIKIEKKTLKASSHTRKTSLLLCA